MEQSKTAVVGMLVLFAVVLQTSLACQCLGSELTLEGTYCHRLVDQNERTALVQAEVCDKEYDDGFAEHFIAIQAVYLEPLLFRQYGASLMPSLQPQSCLTMPRLAQTMLLTSRDNRGGLCGVPHALHVGNSYVMEKHPPTQRQWRHPVVYTMAGRINFELFGFW